VRGENKMLNRNQKIYLIKKVDCFALSDRRIEALKEYAKIFPIAQNEIKEISDFVMLREETVAALVV
jgi:hypothetical protein